jgi:hypothetical protein
MPWIAIFAPVFLLSFFTLFIHIQTIALDKNIDIINKNKLIVYDLNEVWRAVFIFSIVNFTANFFLEKTNSRYKYIFFCLNLFLVLVFGLLTIISYFSL